MKAENIKKIKDKIIFFIIIFFLFFGQIEKSYSAGKKGESCYGNDQGKCYGLTEECPTGTKVPETTAVFCDGGLKCCAPVSNPKPQPPGEGGSCGSGTGICYKEKCPNGIEAYGTKNTPFPPGGDYCAPGLICCPKKASGGGSNGSGDGSQGANSVVDSKPVNIEFPNPLKFNTVEQVLTSVLNALQGVIVVISIIFIIIGAILYITSTGDEKRIEMAKKAITASLIGLAIGIAAPTLLREIYTILGAEKIPDEVKNAKPIAEIAFSVLNFLLSIVGVLAIIMLIVGGIMYLTSAGDEDRIDTGKKVFKYALLGIVVALASLVLVKQLATFFT